MHSLNLFFLGKCSKVSSVTDEQRIMRQQMSHMVHKRDLSFFQKYLSASLEVIGFLNWYPFMQSLAEDEIPTKSDLQLTSRSS